MTQEKTMGRQMKEKKQSKGPAGMTEKELKESKIGKIRSKKKLKELMEKDDMSYKPLNLSEEKLLKRAMDSLLAIDRPKQTYNNVLKRMMTEKEKSTPGIAPFAKGGEVKKYRGGGSVHNNKKQYGTKGYRAARKPK